jgi:hypothetical protein
MPMTRLSQPSSTGSKLEHGKLDILVNNAANLIATTTDAGGFWEKPLEAVELLNVGLRGGAGRFSRRDGC